MAADSPSPRRSVPRFTPVPVRGRKDGWTPFRQADFLGALCETFSVAAAARRVGMSRESAYRLRERPGAESFAAAWNEIMAQKSRIEAALPRLDQLWHRAFYGTLKPVMRRGRHVGTLKSQDNHALLQLFRRELGPAMQALPRSRRSR